MSERIVVAYAGPPGSGKTTASFYSQRYGLKYYCPGDLIRAEAKGLGRLLDGRADSIVLLHEMEVAEGLDVLMRPALTSSEDMVIDGIRRMHDLHLLRKSLRGANFHLVAITSNMKDCHQRAVDSLDERGGRDSPDFEVFKAAALAEAWNEDPLEPSTYQVMAQADFIVPNSRSCPEFLTSIDTVMQAIRRKNPSQQG